MNGLLWNILLALVWAALSGDFTPANLILGFGVGFMVILFLQRVLGLHSYTTKLPKILKLGAFFLWELLLANFNVMYHVITPSHLHRPGIIGVPLDVRSDLEITVLAHMVSLTPGTLSIHLSDDSKTLYIHALDIKDADKLRRRVKNGFEKRIIEVIR